MSARQILRRRAIILPALLLACGSAAPSAFARADGPPLVRLASGGSTSDLSVPIGKTKTLETTTSYIDLVVGDPDIADAMPLTDHSFYIHGKKAGETTISAYDAQKNLVGSLEIEVGADSEELNQELRKDVTGSSIHATTVNGHIMLKGTARDAVALDQALSIAKEFDPDPINSMTVAQPQQVMLQVRFIEVSRNAGRELGASWAVAYKGFGATTQSFTPGFLPQPLAPATNNVPFGTILQNILAGGVSADVEIRALEQKGLARRLADPDLVAMSGQTASFLAGGEYPIPVQSQNNTITVAYKKYGVGLSFTPVVLSDGMIDLKISPEVSQLDTTNTVSAGGVTVPSLVVRRVTTEIELKDGQSFAIAGLLQHENSEMINQLPWIGQVPVLGALFRDAAFMRNETDLAVIVTPRLVRPATPAQRLRTPTDGSAPANDFDRFLRGEQEVPPREQRFPRASRVAYGHMLQIGSAGGSDADR